MQKNTSMWLVPLLLAVGAAGALTFYWMQTREPPPAPVAAVSAPAPEPEPQLVPEPDHPLPEPVAPAAEPADLVPLPPLDQSDDYFKLELQGIFGAALDEMLVSSGVIERVVASVDNLTRPQVAERIRPLGRVDGQFIVDGQDDIDEYRIDGANFERYDELVAMIASADLDEVAEVYRRFYPLFQKSYEDLGYPDGYFNDRLVAVIDHLLDTPDVGDSLALVRPHVLYEYADPSLENRSSGQKLLLRMGSDHRARVKRALRDFRGIVTRL